MSSFTNVCVLNAPNKPLFRNQAVLLIGAESFSLDIVRKAFGQAPLDPIYRSRMQRGIIRFESAPSSPLNCAVVGTINTVVFVLRVLLVFNSESYNVALETQQTVIREED